MSLDFFKCEHCGNIAVKPFDSGVPLVCCGETMIKLEANTTDAATEKHVPVAVVNGAKIDVTVGSVEHPMEDDHYITFICLETKKGYQLTKLAPGAAPKASFVVADGDDAVAVYEYCNKHGLWKAEL